MGKWACQLDIYTRSSWGCELTYETISISIGGLQPQLYVHSEVLIIFSMYVVYNHIFIYNVITCIILRMNAHAIGVLY